MFFQENNKNTSRLQLEKHEIKNIFYIFYFMFSSCNLEVFLLFSWKNMNKNKKIIYIFIHVFQENNNKTPQDCNWKT
jgi:uncharacterized membrane-anchored protein YitT (DUF2179 family)